MRWTGLTKTYVREKDVGAEPPSEGPVLTPVLNYQLILPEGCDTHGMLLKLRQLEEEDPELHIVWNEELGEIHAQLSGGSTDRDFTKYDSGTISDRSHVWTGKYCI